MTISNTVLVNKGQYVIIQINNKIVPGGCTALNTIICQLTSSYCIQNYNIANDISTYRGGSVNLTVQAVCGDGDDSCASLSVCSSSVVYTVSVRVESASVPTFYPTRNPPRQCKLDTSNDSTSVAYIMTTVVFVILALFLYIIRKGSKTIYQISVFSMIFQLLICGLDLISDCIYIVFLFNGSIIPEDIPGISVTAIATIMLMTRIIHPFQTYVIANGLAGKAYHDHYMHLVDKEHLIKFGKEYAVLLVVSLLECTAVKFFPWLENDFIKTSGGYPTPFFFRIVAYGKIVGSLISCIVQMVTLSTTIIITLITNFATKLDCARRLEKG